MEKKNHSIPTIELIKIRDADQLQNGQTRKKKTETWRILQN